MDKQKLPAMLDQNQIEALLAKIEPRPSQVFFKKIEQAPWRVSQEQEGQANSLRPRWVIAMTVAVVMVGILIITPQGRAWAQEVFQFFKKVDFTAIPLSEKELEQYNYFVTSRESYDLPLVPVFIPTVAPEMFSLPGCDTAEKAQSYICQIAYAESQLGFELMEFPEKPQNMEFQDTLFDKQTKFAMIEYESPGMLLRLSQRLGEAPEAFRPWPWVPAGDVEKIKVGAFDGEYVSGGFNLSTQSGELVWNDTTSTQRVAWSDGTYWYLLDSGGQLMNRERLIELAASLVAKPNMVEKQPDPEALNAILTSVAEAEAYSGLDLKAPTLLPIGFVFSEAHYTSLRKNEVSLHYEGNNVGSNSLVIHVKKDNSINFETLSTTQGNSEVVKVNGQNAYYGFMEDGASPYLFLSWQDGDLNYRMYFYWYNDIIHGVINKQKMIAIAESIDDINVFKNKVPRPYKHVKIYEQALDIDIHEFSTIPAGWSFSSFWVGAWEKCIGLSYTLSHEQGRILLDQCGTDTLLESSDIPLTAIENASVGKNSAQYITGDSEYDSNGIRIWRSDLPVRRLRWKEDELWIQITLYGEVTLSSDKEDLITIAESLQ
jgi:hypothetical protein